MDDKVRVEDQPARRRPDVLTMMAELRQRHLFRIAVAYGVGAWLIIQIVATVGPAFELPSWVLRAVILASIVGFLATMGVLLFRPRREGRRTAIYLSRPTRLIAGGGVLLVALVAGGLSINSLRTDGEVSLAVLPFADLSPGRDKAYFAEGVAEEILSTLSTEKGIKVLGRTSARELDRNPDPRAVRRTLGVTHLLEGSARTSGDQLRVNVRLIDTVDGSRVWEEEYDGQLADVFKVQDKIANAVVRRLRGSLIARVAEQSDQADSIDSYQTYLAARALMRDRSTKPLKQAFALARRLVAADPDYAPGQALLAELYFLLSDYGTAYGDMPINQARRLALPHARTAIRLAPDKPDGYAALGLISVPDHAIAPLRQAIALDPSRAELRIWLGIALTALGRNDEGFAQYRAAADIEPLWPVAINRLTQALAASGRVEEAAATVRQYRQRGGSEAHALRFTSFVARARDDISGAIAADRAALALDPTLPYVAGWLVQEYHLLGLASQALGVEQARGGGAFRRLWIIGDRAGLVRLARSNPESVALAVDADVAIFGLGAARDWQAIGELLGRDDVALAEFCASQYILVPHVIIALRETGQAEKSRRLFDCMRNRVATAQKMTMRAPDDDPGRLEMRKASALALSGDRSAVDWLDRAVNRGWSGQYYSSQLADWPQFDALRGDPRMAALQRTIDARIARERAETLRDLSQSAR